ncbi:MAG: S26 family signal peptidase [Planctomycetota bacterium]
MVVDSNPKPQPEAPSRRGGSPREEAASGQVQPRPDGIRETIDSIVMAFVLAFIFRAFVVEAFIIPTGSMAPGLYGKHGTHRCAVCSYSFAYGISEDPSRNPLLQTNGFVVRCPNCGWSGKGNQRLNATADTHVLEDAGDRILVLKWPYDIGGEFLGPKRWDVVVFKNTQDGEMNYIKRLIGRPGEIVELVGGDLYAASASDVDQDIVDALSVPPPPGQPFKQRLSQAQEKRLTTVLKIQRKTRVAQESLWMIHYDHDFQPDRSLVNPGNERLLREMLPRWRPASPGAEQAWDPETPLVRFIPPDDAEYRLELSGQPVKDDYGYNNVGLVDGRSFSRGHPIHSLHGVGDLLLSFVLIPRGVEGHLAVWLGKGPDAFEAKIAADGTVTLDTAGPKGARIPLGEARGIGPLQVGEPLTIEFENVDFRVALRINGEEVLATDDSQYGPHSRHGPSIERLRSHPVNRNSPYDESSAALAASRLPLEIRHLTVYRDVYYRSDQQLDVLGNGPRAGHPGWGTQGNPILLRADPPEYFCCGDNSPASKDSRLWWEVSPKLAARTGDDKYSFGTVPGDQLIGRAFFVYWPSGFRISSSVPAMVPNVGKMRIIR